jgi:hypothetical protein
MTEPTKPIPVAKTPNPAEKKVKKATSAVAAPQPPAAPADPKLRLPRVLARVEEIQKMEREGVFGQAPLLAARLQAIRDDLDEADRGT